MALLQVLRSQTIHAPMPEREQCVPNVAGLGRTRFFCDPWLGRNAALNHRMLNREIKSLLWDLNQLKSKVEDVRKGMKDW